MSVRRNARTPVNVGVHVRFRGVKWRVVALSGQDINLLGPDGGGQTVLAGHLFSDPGFTAIGPTCLKPPQSEGCSGPPSPWPAKRHCRAAARKRG